VHVTARVDYALQAMVALADSETSTIPANTLAERLDLSYTYLLAIVGDLRRAGFVTMQRGQAGGLRLARPAHDIMLSEIIRAIDGPLTLADGTEVESIADPDPHPDSGDRVRLQLPSLWAAAHHAMLDVFARIPLSEACSIGVGHRPIDAADAAPPGMRSGSSSGSR
jgi:Rrf2 family protein